MRFFFFVMRLFSDSFRRSKSIVFNFITHVSNSKPPDHADKLTMDIFWRRNYTLKYAKLVYFKLELELKFIRIRRGSRTCLDGIIEEGEPTDTPARYFDIAVMKKLTENKQQQNSETE